ncbi:MAG: LysM peptidoglycan-binding domain-containing protein, partial [Caldilineaceae bacterium]
MTIKPTNSGQSLRVTMRFDPQDQQELRNHSGFFLLDEDRLRAVYAGGSPIYNNIAAGSPDPYRASNELFATVSQAVGEYTVIIYNNTDIPMTFQLSVENGTFPMEMEVKQQAAEQPAAQEAEQVAPASVASRDTATDKVYVVQAGDTISLISERLYGDYQYYQQLCAYNSIDNCNIIEIGQGIRTPGLNVLTGTNIPAPVVRAVAETPVAAQPVSTPVSVSSSGDSYTVAAGDTLGTIAQKVYGDFQRFRDICTANALTDCNVISVGQVLCLPDGSTLAQSPAAPPVAAQASVAQASTSAPAPTAAPAPTPAPTVAAVSTATAVSTPVPVAQPVAAAPAAPSQSDGSDIPSILEKSADKSVFLLLWNTTGQTASLKGSGPITVFVPSDEAFAPSLQTNLNTWMDNKSLLQQLLSSHVVAQSFDAASLSGSPINLATMAGTSLRVERTASGGLLVNG